MAEISHLLEIKDNLQSYKDPKGTLKTLNTILEAASSNTEILQIASVINPHMVFLYFTSEHDTFKVWDISCNILSKMLGAFPVVEIIKMSQELELGLQHAYDGVRVLCTKLLWYKLSSFQSLSSLLLQSTMFHLITQLIGDSCLESSQNVSNIIECLFNNEDSVLIITSTELGRSFLLDLQGLAESSDINRFRVYDLVVRLTKGSETAFQFVCASGFINRLIGELESKDVLLKLNCLELLQALTETCRGMELVDSADVLKKLHALLSSTNDDPFGAILIPGELTLSTRLDLCYFV
jgi:26S proteasome non-ATPase regulatory subunit 5